MEEKLEKKIGNDPKILVFSTEKISDPGLDLAGLLKMHYPASVLTIPLPCSSAVKPKWILHALKHGIDGVFIAADGTDCPYRSDCADLTSALVGRAQNMLREEGINPARLKMAAICSVCAEPFVNHMKNFSEALKKL
jgi:F420-non-reducing hydrogenase iron-sulfur subunit